MPDAFDSCQRRGELGGRASCTVIMGLFISMLTVSIVMVLAPTFIVILVARLDIKFVANN